MIINIGEGGLSTHHHHFLLLIEGKKIVKKKYQNTTKRGAGGCNSTLVVGPVSTIAVTNVVF